MAKWDGNILHSCDDLRKLLVENPDLPLLVFAVFAGEDAYSECGYAYACASSVCACLGEVLVDKGPYGCAFKENMIYCIRDEAEADFEKYLFGERTDEQKKWTEEQWNEYVQQEFHKCTHWEKCIILYVDN